MDQDFAITALIRQGYRQCETSQEIRKIRFEWRDQNINIPPHSTSAIWQKKFRKSEK